jgi:predicted DNA-binding protein (UPF0251 family)
MLKLNYEERNALAVVRKSMQRNPAMATALLEGMTKQVAVNVLLQAKKELADLLVVTQAITKAAGDLASSDALKEDINVSH